MSDEPPFTPELEPQRFWRAAEFLAAAWYAARGFVVTMTSEGARYDIIVERGGTLSRVQVKSSTCAASGKSWRFLLTSQAYDGAIVSGANGRRRPATYGVGDVDEFLFVTRDQRMFRIPREVLGSRTEVSLPGRFGAFEVTWE